MTRTVAWFGGLQFLALLVGVSVFLWHADSAPPAVSSVWLAVLAAALWAVGAVMQGRIGILEVLLIESAALATATAAVGMVELHRVFKPLTMVLAIALVATRPRAPGFARFDALLMAALAFSLLGDVFLMLPGRFIPGLVVFLIAHLCYVALLRQGVGWLPRPAALAATLGVGAAIYALLFPGLDPVLKGAVAAYVVVIAVMAAQAIGRAAALRDPASLAVAIGAVFFMASDTLLALNRFWQPLPMAQFWVLATYYVAQTLIAVNARPVSAGDAAARLSPA